MPVAKTGRIRRTTVMTHILLLIITLIVVFYPTAGAEVSLIDDQSMLDSVFNTEHFSLKDLLFPRVKLGGYYRPLIGLSFHLDKYLWGLDARAMHFESILMHLLNVLLVYALARRFFAKYNGAWAVAPLLAALIFGLHPATTESVNWISGRTDIMAANFILTGTLLLSCFLKSRRLVFIVGTFASLVLAVLSKETSFAFIPALWFIFKAHGDANNSTTADSPTTGRQFISFLICYTISVCIAIFLHNYWLVLACGGCYALWLLLPNFRRADFHVWVKTHVNSILVFSLSGIIGLVTFFSLRKLVFESNIDKLGQTLNLMAADTNYTISVFLGASGFYVKKFFLPLPLNFFIYDIDPLYDFIGILAFLLCIHLIARRDTVACFVLAGVCMFLPALPFAFGTIAWTAYAERYIYISSAFWSIAFIYFIAGSVERLSRPYMLRVATITIIIVLSLEAGATWNRNIVWQKNLTLLEDTIAQAPRIKMLREIYMYALVKAGRFADARRQYEIADKLHALKYDERADHLMADIMRKDGRDDEALKYYEKAVIGTKYHSEQALEALVTHVKAMLALQQRRERRIDLERTLVDAEVRLAKLTNDPFKFYRLGQVALHSNRPSQALIYFQSAFDGFPPSSPYRGYAAKLIQSLTNRP